MAVLGRVPGHGAPRRALQAVLEVYCGALGLGRAGLTLRLVDEDQCRLLNLRFRGLDRPTDVLYFPAEATAPAPGFRGYLGDLALCPPYAWRRRGRFNPDFGAEAAFLALHGLLHLSGRHHDTPRQEAALEKLSLRLHPLGRARFAALRRLGPSDPGGEG